VRYYKLYYGGRSYKYSYDILSYEGDGKSELINKGVLLFNILYSTNIYSVKRHYRVETVTKLQVKNLDEITEEEAFIECV